MIFLSFRNGKNTLSEQLIAGEAEAIALTLVSFTRGFGFLNPDKGRGKTKGLDLQLRLYPRKWAIDVLGTFIKSYYLDPEDENGLRLTNYYLRPDIKRDVIGISAFRVANADKFSYGLQ